MANTGNTVRGFPIVPDPDTGPKDTYDDNRIPAVLKEVVDLINTKNLPGPRVTGPAGPVYAGASGITGSTGPRGNSDLVGPAFDVGLTGHTGATGDTGPAGVLTGHAGPGGASGPAGVTGSNTGPTGPRGVASAVGLTGPTGNATGPTGSSSNTGNTGPTGVTGPPNPYSGLDGLLPATVTKWIPPKTDPGIAGAVWNPGGATGVGKLAISSGGYVA
jgi:hypothetical protein